MIIAIVPSPLRFSAGTVMHGSTGNTVLPDYLLGTKIHPIVLLNKTIGDELILPIDGFYKVYSVEGGLLHEYSMYRMKNAAGAFVYIPLSLKRYHPAEQEKCSYTYLYIKGISTLLDLLRGVRNYTIISLYQLLQMVDMDQANVIYRNGIPYDPISISLEDPEVMVDLLADIAQTGLSSPADTRMCIEMSLQNCQDGVTLLDKIPDDYISCCACSYAPFIEENALLSKRDMGQCALYSQVAQDQVSNMMDKELLPLDLSTEVFSGFEFERIISHLYCLPYTNVVLEMNEFGSIERSYFSTLFQDDCVTRPRIQFWIPRILADAMHVYNNTHMIRVIHLTLCKTWLDELYFTMYFADGGHQCFYMNLCAYHLYTPSLIRLHPIR